MTDTHRKKQNLNQWSSSLVALVAPGKLVKVKNPRSHHRYSDYIGLKYSPMKRIYKAHPANSDASSW